jgi:ribosomal protein S18 acetylase RimI-like enzyme
VETIRRAVAADAEAIREVLVSAFSDNFAGILDDDVIASVCASSFALDGIADMIGRDGMIALVGETGGRIEGHALGSVDRGVMTLHRLYVRPDGQRGGLGSRLLAAACAAAGSVTLHRLHVIRSNAKAVAFYCRAGFDIAGETEDDLGPVIVPVFEMIRATTKT